MSCDARVALSSVADIVSTKVAVSSLTGHPYISTENLLPNLGGLGDGVLPDAERVNSFNKSDTLFSNIRPYFRKVQYAVVGGGCSADVLVFRTKDPQEFWPAYLYYCLADRTFIDHTMATCKGAKMPRGDKGAMLQYQVSKPDLDTQKRVSSFLRSVDESIQTLQQQNSVLESIAQTLFRSWFVNFDPVHAKAAGNEPEAMSAELAALFPNEFEDSELGLIPKEWSVQSVENLLTRLRPKKRFDSSDVEPSGTVPIFDQSSQSHIGFCNAGAEIDASQEQPAFIFGDHTCVTRLSTKPFNVSPNVIPLSGKQDFGYWAFYAVHKIQPFEGYRRHWSDFAIRKVVVPSFAVAKAFGNLVGPLHSCVDHNLVQLCKLEQLRDHLLPRLISGKLSLEDAEGSVAEIALGLEKEPA